MGTTQLNILKVLLLSLYIHLIRCQFYYSDTPLFVQSESDIVLKAYVSDPEIFPKDTVFSKFIQFPNGFLSPPKVLLGINTYDNQYYQYYIDFSLAKIQVFHTAFQTQLNVTAGTSLYALHINYLAIDTTIYKNYYISDTIEQPVKMILQSNNQYKCVFTVPYQLRSIVSGEEKRVQAFLLGFATNQENSSYSMDRFSVYFSVISLNSDTFTIQVLQQKGSLILTKVRFNFIEINENNYKLLKSEILKFEQFLDASSNNCLTNPKANKECGGTTDQHERYLNASQTLTISSPLVQKTKDVFKFFLGLNTFTAVRYNMTVQNEGFYNPRFRLVNQTYPNNTSVQFQFMVWYFGSYNSIAAYGVMIMRRQCTQPNEKINNDKCITDSSKCDPGTQDLGGYCTYCDDNCLTCKYTPTLCTSCQQGLYLVSNTCQVGQPQSGYFCRTVGSDQFTTCSACADQNCFSCSSTFVQSCTKCSNGYYWGTH